MEVGFEPTEGWLVAGGQQAGHVGLGPGRPGLGADPGVQDDGIAQMPFSRLKVASRHRGKPQITVDGAQARFHRVHDQPPVGKQQVVQHGAPGGVAEEPGDLRQAAQAQQHVIVHRDDGEPARGERVEHRPGAVLIPQFRRGRMPAATAPTASTPEPHRPPSTAPTPPGTRGRGRVPRPHTPGGSSQPLGPQQAGTTARSPKPRHLARQPVHPARRPAQPKSAPLSDSPPAPHLCPLTPDCAGATAVAEAGQVVSLGYRRVGRSSASPMAVQLIPGGKVQSPSMPGQLSGHRGCHVVAPTRFGGVRGSVQGRSGRP